MDENEKMMIDKDEFFFLVKKSMKETAEKTYGSESVTTAVFISQAEKCAEAAWDMLVRFDSGNRLLKEDKQAAEEQKQAEFKDEIIKRLWKDAEYAVNSYDMNLLYQALGKLKMAVDGGLVTYEEVREIDQYIIPQHMNNPEWFRIANDE